MKCYILQRTKSRLLSIKKESIIINFYEYDLNGEQQITNAYLVLFLLPVTIATLIPLPPLSYKTCVIQIQTVILRNVEE